MSNFNRYLLTFVSNHKIAVIQQIRIMTGMDLVDAKNAFERGLIVTHDQLPAVLTNLPTLIASVNGKSERDKCGPAWCNGKFDPITLEIKIAMHYPTPQPVELQGFAF